MDWQAASSSNRESGCKHDPFWSFQLVRLCHGANRSSFMKEIITGFDQELGGHGIESRSIVGQHGEADHA